MWLLCMKCFPPLLTLSLISFSTAALAVSGIELTLSDGHKLDVDLAEARLISEFEGYAIIAGRSCVDCDENTAIYFEKIADATGWSHPPESEPPEEPEMIEGFAAPEDDSGEAWGESDEDLPLADTDGVLPEDLSGERFTYPGKYRDYETKKLVEKTRMFYGACHESLPSVLWLTEYLTTEGWAREEYLIVFREEGVEHRYNEDRQPSIYYIENESCIEIPGISASTEP